MLILVLRVPTRAIPMSNPSRITAIVTLTFALHIINEMLRYGRCGLVRTGRRESVSAMSRLNGAWTSDVYGLREGWTCEGNKDLAGERVESG